MSNIYEDREIAGLRLKNLEINGSLEEATAEAKNLLADLMLTPDGRLNIDSLTRSQMAHAVHLIRFCMVTRP